MKKRRQIKDVASFESRVIEGLDGPVTPLTSEDLESVRNLVRKARTRIGTQNAGIFPANKSRSGGRR